MPSSQDNGAARVDDGLIDEAAQLLLRVKDARGGAAVEAEARNWQARSPAHAKAWSTAERFWAITGKIGGDHPIFSDVPRPARTTTKPLPWMKPRRMAVAAGVAAAACLVLTVAPSISLMWQADYRTGTGENRSVTLADGTHVELDTGSAMVVDDASNGRGVKLLAGRAWFDVTKDPTRPFHVLAGDVKVTVTGTQFDVGLDRGAVDVRLAEGSVRADYLDRSGAASRALRPGEHFHYDGARLNAGVAPVAIGSIAAWRRGKLLVEGASVEELVDQIRPYYSGMIMIRGQGIRTRRITGTFSLRDPADALRTIVEPHHGTVTQVTPWVLIVSGD